jgi:hypothetical protein
MDSERTLSSEGIESSRDPERSLPSARIELPRDSERTSSDSSSSAVTESRPDTEYSFWSWVGGLFYSTETTVTNVVPVSSNPSPKPKPIVKVYTAIFGSYDKFVCPVAQTIDMEFYAFVDDKIEVYKYENQADPVLINTLPAYDFPKHEIFHEWQGKPSESVIKNIILRFMGPQIDILQSDILIYADGNVRIKNKDFIEKTFVKLMESSDCELFLSSHPARKCFRKEIIASRTCAKYANSDLERMGQTYADLEDNAGLYWNGLLGYNLMNKTMRTASIEKLNTFLQDYLFDSTLYAKDKNKLYWPQCQINLPGLIRKHKINIHVLPTMYFNMIVAHGK